MICYPRLLAELAERDPAELAATAGVEPETLRVLAAGGLAPSLSVRRRLAVAMGVPSAELFRLSDDLEEALAGAPSRFVSDPETLRLVDRRN